MVRYLLRKNKNIKPKYTEIILFFFEGFFIREFQVVNLKINHRSPSYSDLRINLIPLQCPVEVTPCRENFNRGSIFPQILKCQHSNLTTLYSFLMILAFWLDSLTERNKRSFGMSKFTIFVNSPTFIQLSSYRRDFS